MVSVLRSGLRALSAAAFCCILEGTVGAAAGAFTGLVATGAGDLGEIIAGKPACCLSVAPGIAFCTIGDKLDRAGVCP